MSDITKIFIMIGVLIVIIIGYIFLSSLFIKKVMTLDMLYDFRYFSGNIF